MVLSCFLFVCSPLSSLLLRPGPNMPWILREREREENEGELGWRGIYRSSHVIAPCRNGLSAERHGCLSTNNATDSIQLLATTMLASWIDKCRADYAKNPSTFFRPTPLLLLLLLQELLLQLLMLLPPLFTENECMTFRATIATSFGVVDTSFQILQRNLVNNYIQSIRFFPRTYLQYA